MTEETQRIAWSVLPKEFKEEVRTIYAATLRMVDKRESAEQIYINKLSTLEGIFGFHNLTSDAQEEEMLTVPRNKVIEVRNKYAAYVGYKLQPLLDLFGSKCLPDNVDSLEHNVDTLEPSAAEPEEDKAEAIAGKAIKPVEEHFDTILKDSFSKERRLNVAAMAMQALLSNPAFTNMQTKPDTIVDLAITTADMLIKKSH